MIRSLRIWARIAFFAPIVVSAQEGVDPVGWWRATMETPAGEVSTTNVFLAFVNCPSGRCGRSIVRVAKRSGDITVGKIALGIIVGGAVAFLLVSFFGSERDIAEPSDVPATQPSVEPQDPVTDESTAPELPLSASEASSAAPIAAAQEPNNTDLPAWSMPQEEIEAALGRVVATLQDPSINSIGRAECDSISCEIRFMSTNGTLGHGPPSLVQELYRPPYNVAGSGMSTKLVSDVSCLLAGTPCSYEHTLRIRSHIQQDRREDTQQGWPE